MTITPEPPFGPGLDAHSEGKTSALHIDNHVAALLCYLPIVPLNLVFSVLWLATEPKDSRFVRFHAAQSLLLALAGVAGGMAIGVLSLIATWMASAIAGNLAAATTSLVFGLASLAWGLLLFGVAIYAMVQSGRGQVWRLPYIGDYAERLARV